MNMFEEIAFDIAWKKWHPPIPRAYADIASKGPTSPVVALKLERRTHDQVVQAKRERAILMEKKRIYREAYYNSRNKRETK